MTPDEERDLERARSIAVSLEQELARVTAERDRAVSALEAVTDALLTWTDQGDVVGQEGVPVGDPWAEVADGWDI